MKNITSIATAVLLLGILGTGSRSLADNSSAGNPPDRGHAPNGHRGPPHGPGGLLGPEGMKACATAAGFAFVEGQRPTLSDEQKAQIKSCLDNRETAMKACLSTAGVQLPAPPQPGERPSGPPPQLNDAVRSAIDNCRSQVLGASSGSADSSTVTSSESTATGSAL